MCGILGRVADQKTSPSVWGEAMDYLKHRGPDGVGSESIFVGGKHVQLGHTRLSILDHSEAGHQPMESKSKRWWITFNGEVYNHLALRGRLSVDFYGHSDTETLVELIDALGIDKALPLLNGIFAFAALDREAGVMYLVRDPFGVKPLYYMNQRGGFIFASEVRALKRLCSEFIVVDPFALSTFLTLRFVPSPQTMWKGICRLQAGHFLRYDLNSNLIEVKCYVSPTTEIFQGSQLDAVHEYEIKFRDAIRRQMLSDVPIGLLLSGGLDSALIAAIAKDLGANLPCYSVGFDGNPKECEISKAKETASILGLPFTAVHVNPALLLKSLPAILSCVEEPLGTTSILPMWYLMQEVGKDFSVVLTGQGVDEPWGGYRRYQSEIMREFLPHFLQQRVGFFRVLLQNSPEFIERGLRSMPVDNMQKRFLEVYSLFPLDELNSLIHAPSLDGALGGIGYWIDWLSGVERSPAEKMMRIDTRMNLSDDLLLYGDKISMAFSVEARVPMLDIELVRFVESLPIRYRTRLLQAKIVHKQLAGKCLPNHIVDRKKLGFQIPFAEWSRGIWKKYIEDLLLASDAPHWQLLKKDGVQRCWNEHLNGKKGTERKIFSLLILAIWWHQQ